MHTPLIDPALESHSGAIGAIIAAFRAVPSIALKHLERQGIATPGPDGRLLFAAEWVPMQAWVALAHGLVQEAGEAAVYASGLRIMEHALWPPHVHDIESAMRSVDVAYHMNHRKSGVVMFDPTTGRMLEGIGHFAVNRVQGERRLVVTCDTPYPCDLDRGVMTGTVIRFSPRAQVVHQPDIPCRKKGDTSCRYVVTW